MNASKIAAALLIGALMLIALSVNSIFNPSEEEIDYLNNADKFYAKLTGPNSKMTGIEDQQLVNDQHEISKWIKLDTQHFSLQLPDNFYPRYRDVFLSIHKESAITCGKVAFSAQAQEWKPFISSRRSEVALTVGDEKTSNEEFYQLYNRVCKEL